MTGWFATSWLTMLYVTGSTVAIYLTMLVAIRLAGRRTISQMSAFDAVVTVALGTTLASTAAAPDPSYLEGTTVLMTLLALQLTIAAARQRFSVARRLLDFAPEAVVRGGKVRLPRSLLSSQLSMDELRAELRLQGVFDLEDVQLVLIEPTGGISVARTTREADAAAAGSPTIRG